MPESTTPSTPTVTTSANVNAAALATSFAQARSPLEAALDTASNQAVSPALDPAQLDQMRQRDAQQQWQTPAAKPPAPAAPAPKLAAAPEVPALNPDADKSLTWKPKKRADWDAVKAKGEAREKELLNEIAQLRGTGSRVPDPLTGALAPDDAEITRLRAEHAEMSGILKKVAVESDPEFRAKYDSRRNSAFGQVKFAAGGAAKKLEPLLAMPPSEVRDTAIDTIIGELSPTTQARIRGALAVVDQIDIERQVEIDGRKASWETDRQRLVQQQTLEQQQKAHKLNTAFNKLTSSWLDPDDGHPLFQKRQNDPTWNAGIDRALRVAQEVFSGKSDAEELAAAALLAGRSQDIIREHMTLVEKYSQLEAAYARVMGATPGSGQPQALTELGGNHGSTPPPTDPGAYHGHFGGALAAARQRDGYPG